MGSKGSNTVTTNQSQTFTPNPQIGAAGTQALTQAQAAASSPFQMPVAPVAGFNPQQLQAFQETQQAQGMAQPYFQQGANYLQQSAAPVTGQDVANYYNPMAANVTAQMQNIFGQQNVQNTGNLVQSAGGVGADRVAVGQANMANQQSLAAGQTYAGLYQQALQSAEQQKQMEAGAGYGIGQLGGAAQSAQLQGIGALLGTGAQQQQLSQAQQNAQYQNILAQIAYPYQQAQYLAGITGGLAPAMGGTTTGQATTQYPSPSPFAQILGLGTAGIGAFGSMGGFGSNPSYGGGNFFSGDAYGGNAANPLPGLTAADYGNRGGRIEKKADGGSAYGRLDQDMYRKEMGSILPQAEAGNPMAMEVAGDLPTFDDGGPVLNGEVLPPMSSTPGGMPGGVQGAPFPGASAPKIGGASPIPQMQMQPGGGRSMLPYGEGMYIQPPHMQGGSGGGGGGSNTGSEISQGISAAMQMLPLLAGAKRGGHVESEGGAVNPMHMGEGFDDGGDVDFNTGTKDTSTPLDDELTYWGSRWTGATPPPADAAPPMSPSPSVGFTTPANAATPSPAAPMGDVPLPQPRPQQAAAQPPMAAPTQRPMPQQAPTQAAAPPSAPMGAQQLAAFQAPYPDALDRDWGQQATRSPWMALVKAGATMAQSTGPIGSVIGKGISAGAGELEGQRKSLESEESINLKAQQLHEEAQRHLDAYTRMTPYQREELGLRAEHLNMLRNKFNNMNLPPAVLHQIQKDVMGDAVWSVRTPEEQNAEIIRRAEQMQQLHGQQGSGAAAAVAPAGETAVGEMKQFKQGMGRKIKAGPDSDASTWAPAG